MITEHWNPKRAHPVSITVEAWLGRIPSPALWGGILLTLIWQHWNLLEASHLLPGDSSHFLWYHCSGIRYRNIIATIYTSLHILLLIKVLYSQGINILLIIVCCSIYQGIDIPRLTGENHWYILTIPNFVNLNNSQ